MKKVLDYIINKRNNEDAFFQIISFNDKNKKLNGNAPYFYISKEDNLDDVIYNIKEYNKNERGVFINLNPLKTNKNRNKNNVKKINFIFIDLDNASLDNLNTISNYLRANSIKFSYIGQSGNGYHILIDVDFEVSKAEIVKDFLYMLYNNVDKTVDKTVHDPSRIIRVPGSLHFKKEEFQLKTIYFKEVLDEDRIKNNQKILSLLDSKKEKSWKKIIENNKSLNSLYNTYISKGDRSEKELSLIDGLLMKGITDYETINEIMTECKIGKWQESEEKYKLSTYTKALENYTRHIQKDSQNKPKKVINLLTKEKSKIDRIGTGIHNNVFYFGNSVFNDGSDNPIDIIITSDKKIYTAWSKEDNEIRDNFNLSYRNRFEINVLDNAWRNKSIMNYYKNTYDQVNIKDIFDKIKELNETYVYHEDQRTHSLVACDIISNYLCPIFNSKGRMYFQAEYSSGKSTQARIYSKLSFNAIHGDITPASMERVVESTCGSLIIDNYDNLSEDKQKAGAQFIEVYYKKGGKTFKSDGPQFKVNAYNGYSPVTINNIIGLSEVTESRCIKVVMVRTNDPNISRRKIKDEDPIWQDIVDNLHIWTLDNWQYVQKINDELYTHLSDFKNRDLENVEAVMTIAKVIGDDVFEEVYAYLKETIAKQKETNLEANWEFIALKTIYQLCNETQSLSCRLKVADISHIATKESDYLDFPDKNKFSLYLGRRLFSNYRQVFEKQLSGGMTYYNILKKELIKLIKVKGYSSILTVEDVGDGEVLNIEREIKIEKGEKDTKNNTPTITTNTTNSTNTTISTNNTIKELFKKYNLLTKEQIEELTTLSCEIIEKEIVELKNEGVIFEPRKGEFKLLG